MRRGRVTSADARARAPASASQRGLDLNTAEAALCLAWLEMVCKGGCVWVGAHNRKSFLHAGPFAKPAKAAPQRRMGAAA